jgi:hypothetical protein
LTVLLSGTRMVLMKDMDMTFIPILSFVMSMLLAPTLRVYFAWLAEMGTNVVCVIYKVLSGICKHE